MVLTTSVCWKMLDECAWMDSRTKDTDLLEEAAASVGEKQRAEEVEDSASADTRGEQEVEWWAEGERRGSDGRCAGE